MPPMAASIWFKKMSDHSKFQEKIFYKKGSIIFNEGEDGNCAYLIQAGAVDVYTVRNGKEIRLAHFKAGEIFGEMALLVETPRSASVRATEDTNLILIDKNIFIEKMDRSDPTIRAILQMLAQRIINFNNTLAGKKAELPQLINSVESAYAGVLAVIPPAQRADFRKKIQPKMDDFINALKAFVDRFKA